VTMYLLQGLIIFAVVRSNIHWHWTPNHYLASGIGRRDRHRRVRGSDRPYCRGPCNCRPYLARRQSRPVHTCRLMLNPHPIGEDTVTPKQFVEALDRVGFSQRGFARCIDTDERQIRRWVAGDERIPGSVARLLRLMIALGLTEKDINRAGRTIR